MFVVVLTKLDKEFNFFSYLSFQEEFKFADSTTAVVSCRSDVAMLAGAGFGFGLMDKLGRT